MKQTAVSKKRKRNKSKAGFGAANVLLMTVFSGFSFGFGNDVFDLTHDIVSLRARYQEVLEVKEQKTEEMESLIETREKLSN